MKCYTEDDVLSSFLAVFRYAHRYFSTSNINPIEFWSKIFSLADEHIFGKPTTLIIEICLSAPFSNASLERLFSKMNLIKATLLIIAWTIGKTMFICEIYFSQIGFYLTHFHEEIQWKSQKSSGASPQTPPGLCPGTAGRLTAPPKLPADYSDHYTIFFSK